MTLASLHAVAAYVVAPARHRLTGRIGLVPTPTGFATPALPGGGVVAVDGAVLVRADGARTQLTTLREAAAFVGLELDPHPPIGHDLPPFDPDEPLTLDADEVADLASWWVVGVEALDALRRTSRVEVGPEQLWPEHFDVGAVAVLGNDVRVNVGFSPGDTFIADPYVYVGPHDRDGDRSWWNAPFGAARRRGELTGSDDLVVAALDFLQWGLRKAGPTA